MVERSKKTKKSEPPKNPDHQELIPRLRRAQGQVDAVARMIYDREYCPNIIQQLRASASALKSLEAIILRTHLQHCVRDAMSAKNETEAEKKITELISVFKRGND